MLEYLFVGTGIRRAPTKLQLVVGSAVHVGLAFVCTALMASIKDAMSVECWANTIALSINYFISSDTYPHLKEHERREQETLIAGLLWSFYYHSWPLFVATFEVLCVERAWEETFDYGEGMPMVHLSSRPDVIVRHRRTNEFIGISWKTIDSLDDYKRWNYRENLQNMMETHYGEKILARVLEDEYVFSPEITGLRGRALVEAMERAIAEFRQLPREIGYVQTVFLVKGPRQAELMDGTLVNWEELGDTNEQDRTWRQQSMLCYRYVNGGQPTTDPEGLEAALEESVGKARGKKPKAVKAPKVNLSADVSWSYRYWKAGNKSYNNLTADWMRQPIWESDTSVHDWVQQLNNGSVFPSVLADDRNARQPLARVVIWDEPVERNQALMEKTVLGVESAHYDVLTRGFDERGVLLPGAFDRHLSTCYNSAPSAGVPVRCEYLQQGVCFSGDEPLVQIGAGSEWVARVPHHEIERKSFEDRGLLSK